MNTIHEIGLQNQQDFWAMLYLYVGRSILDVCGRRGEKAVRRAVREMAREKGKKLASSYREKGVKTNLETLFGGAAPGRGHPDLGDLHLSDGLSVAGRGRGRIGYDVL